MEVIGPVGSERFASVTRYKCGLRNLDATCGSSCPASGAIETHRGKGKLRHLVAVCEQPAIGAISAFSCDMVNFEPVSDSASVRI